MFRLKYRQIGKNGRFEYVYGPWHPDINHIKQSIPMYPYLVEIEQLGTVSKPNRQVTAPKQDLDDLLSGLVL